MSFGDLSGTLLAERYEVVRRLGEGGSADVFLARDLRYARDVAVKILRPELSAPTGAARFHGEIATLAGLQHPGILPVYDSGEVEGVPFFVTPYVGGHSLRDRLRDQSYLPIEDALRIVREVAEALDYAHERGIIHRDIKPENILLHARHAVLADFGIARAIHVATTERLTRAQVVIGTPPYMSPEQSEPGEDVDATSDIYSLGVVAYEILVGSVPFEGTTPRAVQARKAANPLPSLRSQRPEVRPSMEAAIARALADAPTDRFESAGAFAQALEGTAPQTSLPSRRRLTIATSAAFVGITLGVGVYWLQAGVQPPARPLSRVVVAEFENLTGDTAFSNLGITAVDWLTEGLQRTGVITGVGTETAIRASRFVRTGKTPPSGDPTLNLARETGAEIVVSGRIYRSQDSLKYQIQVTDAKARRLIGAIGPIATPADDPIAGLTLARTRLMGLLAAQVDERLAEFVSELPEAPTYEAYRQFSLGLDQYIGGNFRAAAPLFSAANSYDSTFAAPLLFASISLSNQGRYREADSLLNKLSAARDRLSRFHQAWLDYRRNVLAGQRRAALSAVRAIDSASPGTKATYNHAVEALENGYVEEAITALRSLSPDVGAMRGWIPYFEVLGAAYHIVNRFSDELEIGEEARRRYPDRMYAFLPSVRALAALGRISELDALLRRAGELRTDPYGTSLSRLFLEAGDEIRSHGNNRSAKDFYLRCLASLEGRRDQSAEQDDLIIRARALAALGDWERLAQAARTLLELDPEDPANRGFLGTALARLGHPSEAQSILLGLEADRRPYLLGGPALAQARIATALGDLEAGVAHLARAFAQGKEFDLWVHRDRDFDALRALPSFQALVALRN